MIDYPEPPIVPAWGETNQTAADMIQPPTGFIQSGWPNAATPPSRQRFNWLLHFLANGIRYLAQIGISNYQAGEQYRVNSRIIGDDGKTYMSLINGNIGNTPSTSPGSWKRWGFTADDLLNFAFGSPTAATQATADESGFVATTQYVANKIRLGFDISLGGNGYIKFPTWLSGFTIQWMLGNNTGNFRFNLTEFWPTPFANACLAAFGVPKFDGVPFGTNWQGAGIYITGFDQNSVSAYHDCRSDATTTVNYRGIFLGIGF